MWEFSDYEFIKIFRKMINWEWYTDVNTKTLFLHCLLKANWKSGSWKGQSYERGQFITSLPSLSKETGLTVQEVRTAISHLKATGEITVKKHAKYSVITVLSFTRYQGNQQANQQAFQQDSNRQSTGYQQATNRQSTTDIRNIEYKEDKRKEENPLNPPTEESDSDDEGWGFE